MKYYNQENGLFIENENGMLPGIEWQTGADKFRAIMTLPDSTEPQDQPITLSYVVQTKPSGLTDWIFVRNETIVIGNQNYVSATTPETPDGAGTSSSGYMAELDYYASILGKGIFQPIVPMYHLIMTAITEKEQIPQS